MRSRSATGIGPRALSRVQSSRRLKIVSPGTFENLEWRRLLAKSIAPCSCGSCTLCGNASAAQLREAAANPVVYELATPSSRVRATALTSSFAALDAFTRPSRVAQNVLKPAAYSPFTIDLEQLVSDLTAAPTLNRQSESNGLIVSIPAPDGSFDRFEVFESSVMHPDLAAQTPYIETFVGTGIDDPTANITLDYTSLGFHASVLSAGDDWYVDPYWHRGTEQYVSYFKNKLFTEDSVNWICETPSELHDQLHDHAAHDETDVLTPAPLTSNGTQLRTYDFVVAATGEYTAYHGGAANALSAITTVTARLNQIYERDLAARLQLVANEASVIYPTAASDPFTSPNSPSTSNSQAQTLFDSALIGSANYDVGHVFHRVSSASSNNGLAGGIGTVGTAGIKGQGYSTTSAPIGDPYTIDYVAHELGHQFGGRHTFSSAGGGAGDSASFAVEPGSGSTIMSYAGIGTASENMQSNSDAMFHSLNFDQITTYLSGGTRGATITTTGNTIPTVATPANYVIPASTPFALTGSATDAENDALTYSWEQRNGNSGTLATPTATQTTGPAFRARLPVSSPTRLFPRLATILTGGTSTVGETLPSVARTMNFTLMVRDNNSLGGAARLVSNTVTTVATGAAFSITSNNTSSSILGGSVLPVTWNVAGTTANGINTANVKISLSLDNGNTFPITLAESTANDGTESVTMPFDVGSTQVRLKVEAVGNIFFDINNAALSLVLIPTPASAVPATPVLLSDTGISASDGITKLNNSSPTSVLDFQVGGTVAGALVELLVDGVVVGSATATGTTTTITTNGTTSFADGTRNVTARQTEASKPVSAPSPVGSITVDTVAPAAGTIGLDASSDTGISNSDQITNDNTPTLNVASADSYLQVRRDGTLVSGTYATGTTFTDAAVADGTYTYSVESLDAAGNVSVTTATVVVTVDTVAPALASVPTFNFETGHSLTYVFGEAGIGNFSNSAITVSDGTNTVPATVSYDSGTLTSTITFGVLLANGDYTATLDAGSITDVAGNALVAGSPLAFFVLAGDINRDRSVGFDDLLTLAQNYGMAGKTFSTGNINYDAAGNVDFDDLLLLAQAYGSSLPSLVAGGTTSSPTSAPKLVTSSTKRRVASQVL